MGRQPIFWDDKRGVVRTNVMVLNTILLRMLCTYINAVVIVHKNIIADCENQYSVLY